MKVQPMATSLRVTLSPGEVESLSQLGHDAELVGLHVPPALAEMLARLRAGASDVRHRQAAKRAERDYQKRQEEYRASRERHLQVGDQFSAWAIRTDVADISADPDRMQWVDLPVYESIGKPIPDQCEIRRDVWLVRVVYLLANGRSYPIGSTATHSSSEEEIRPAADGVIARWLATGPDLARLEDY